MNVTVTIPQSTNDPGHSSFDCILEFIWQEISTITMGLYGLRLTMFHKCYQHLKSHITNIPVFTSQHTNELRHGSIDHIIEFS